MKPTLLEKLRCEVESNCPSVVTTIHTSTMSRLALLGGWHTNYELHMRTEVDDYN